MVSEALPEDKARHVADLARDEGLLERIPEVADRLLKESPELANRLIRRWIGFRGMFGFSEWHSNTYFNEDIPPLVNLVDF